MVTNSFSFLTILVTFFQKESCFLAPEIQLPTGRIRGRIGVTESNRTYYAFEKIPYAEPPVGPLRFKAPVPRSKWSGTLDCSRLDISCYEEHDEDNTVESEDCLFLNVVVPKMFPENKKLLPVLFYIYGSQFIYDSSKMYVNSDGITENNVILVTFNYRLGPFGFLSTEDDVIPGNNGLKDQRLALLWTHQNIHLFGGDPKKITIFGHSTGAISCGYLLQKSNKGLFRGAILGNGSPLGATNYQNGARKTAFSFASLINRKFSTRNDSTELLNFLQTVEARVLSQTSRLLYQYSLLSHSLVEVSGGMFWGVVLEKQNPDAFITTAPYQLFKNGDVLKVPLLLGYSYGELSNMTSILPLITKYAYLDLHPDLLVPLDMKVENFYERRKIGQIIKNIYLKNKTPNLFGYHICDSLRFQGDTAFVRSILKFAEMYSKISKTYLFEFAYRGKLPLFVTPCPNVDNVGHVAVSRYTFCAYPKCNISSYPLGDQLAQKQLTKIVADFAKNLNPTLEPSELLGSTKWPLFSTSTGKMYTHIDKTVTVRSHPRNETYPKWVELYESISPYDDFEFY